MRVPDRLRDPAAILEASLLGVVGAGVALLGPLHRWLPVVSGLVIFFVVLAIATWPRRVPEPAGTGEGRRSDPPPADPQRLEDVVTDVRAAAGLVRRWGEADAGDDGPAREAIGLAGGIVRLVLDCEREIEQIGDLSVVQQTEEDLRRLTNQFAVYVNEGDAPLEPDDWNDLVEHFDWIRRELRSIVKRLRES